MQIFVCWVEKTWNPSPNCKARVDLGEQRRMDEGMTGHAVQWKWSGGTERDVEAAMKYAQKEKDYVMKVIVFQKDRKGLTGKDDAKHEIVKHINSPEIVIRL